MMRRPHQQEARMRQNFLRHVARFGMTYRHFCDFSGDLGLQA